MELQKASMWKRIAAWVLDTILTAVLAVGFGVLLSAALNYEGYRSSLQTSYDHYKSQYDIEFSISAEEYAALNAEEKAKYDEAYQALIADQQVMKDYNMVVNLSLVIISVGVLLAILCLEFAVPLWLKNGQTIGKKAFSIGVMRVDGVRVRTLQLFVRALLGKYIIGTMAPIYLLIMIFFGMIGMTGTIILFGLLLTQLICVSVSRNNAAIHDLMAGTVTVDLPSQRIFDSPEALIEYTKRIHAERAQRQDY